jgi:hypothetical protein
MWSRLLWSLWIVALTVFYGTLLVSLLVYFIQGHPLAGAWASLWHNLPVTFVGFVATVAAILWGIQRWRERNESRESSQQANRERIETLIHALGHQQEDTAVRVTAALALGRLRENTPTVALRAALLDKNSSVSSAAALALLMSEGRILFPRLAHDRDRSSGALLAWIELGNLAEALASTDDPRYELWRTRFLGLRRDDHVDLSMQAASVMELSACSDSEAL